MVGYVISPKQTAGVRLCHSKRTSGRPDRCHVRLESLQRQLWLNVRFYSRFCDRRLYSEKRPRGREVRRTATGRVRPIMFPINNRSIRRTSVAGVGGSPRHRVVLRGRLKLHGGDNQGYHGNRRVAMPPETDGGRASPFALFYGGAPRDGRTAVRP